jgi:hypothetical protein
MAGWLNYEKMLDHMAGVRVDINELIRKKNETAVDSLTQLLQRIDGEIAQYRKDEVSEQFSPEMVRYIQSKRDGLARGRELVVEQIFKEQQDANRG